MEKDYPPTSKNPIFFRLILVRRLSKPGRN